MYQIMAIANYEDRFVIPTAHRELGEDAYDLRGSCGFSFGNGCSDGRTETGLFGAPKQEGQDPDGGRLMRKTLKVLSALLTYPDGRAAGGGPGDARGARRREARLPQRNRDRLDRILEELATGDLYDLQERYVLLFDRTRSLSLHLFEHVHGESRDRGQAMVDLKALYERHGLLDELQRAARSSAAVPGVPLRRSPRPRPASCSARRRTCWRPIRQRLKKRKVALFVGVLLRPGAGATPSRKTDVVAALLSEPDEDPNDLAALDAAWEEEEVTFGPGAAAAAQCGKDGLAAKVRAARRPAPGMPVPEPKRPVVTYTPVQPRLRRLPCATPSITSCSAGIPTSA